MKSLVYENSLEKEDKKFKLTWSNLSLSFFSGVWITFSSVLFILFILWSGQEITEFFNIHTSSDNYSSIKLGTLFYLFVVILFSILSLLVIIFDKNQKMQNFKVQFLTINAIALNVFNIILFSVFIYQHRNYQSEFNPTKSNNGKKHIMAFLGFRKWSTFDISLVATFVGVTVLFGYIDDLLPSLPNGGGISLKYIPLMVISFMHSFFAGVVTGMASSLIGIIYNASNIISPWSFLLDYFLPMISPAIVGIMIFDVSKDRDLKTYANYFLHVFIVLSLILLWQTISGVVIWNQLYPDNIWMGYSSFFYSLSYNFLHLFVFSYPIIQLIVPIIYRSLYSVYGHKNAKFNIRY